MDATRRQITKIAREVSKFTVRALKADGIGAGEMDVLHVIRKNPGITQAGIRKRLGLDKGLIARQTASLVNKGYVLRKENPRDKRSRLLFATEKAEGLKNSKARVEAAFYEWLLEPLSADESAAFAAALNALYERCKAESKADFPEMTKRVQEANPYEA